MPAYPYVCDACGEHRDIVKPMAESSREERCTCDAIMRRDLMAGRPRCRKEFYSKELHSDALAVHPEQRAEHQKLYPDVPLDRQCRPVLSSYVQAERYYEKRGVHKPMQRRRRRMTKIA